MPLITEQMPDAWGQFEELVTAILNECGMLEAADPDRDLARFDRLLAMQARESAMIASLATRMPASIRCRRSIWPRVMR